MGDQVVGIIVAVVTGLVALVPAFATSERRRLFRFMKDEAELVDAITDEDLKAEIRQNALVTTKQYRGLARLKKSERYRDHLILTFGPSYLGVLLAVYLISFAGDLTSTDQNESRVEFAGLVVGLSAVGVLLFFALRWSGARSAERRESRQLRQQRERADEAEAALDEVSEKLKPLATPPDALQDEPGAGTGSPSSVLLPAPEELDAARAALNEAMDTIRRARRDRQAAARKGGSRQHPMKVTLKRDADTKNFRVVEEEVERIPSDAEQPPKDEG